MLRRLWCRLFHSRRWRYFVDGWWEGDFLVRRRGWWCSCGRRHIISTTRTEYPPQMFYTSRSIDSFGF